MSPIGQICANAVAGVPASPGAAGQRSDAMPLNYYPSPEVDRP
ncbi:MAG TPA: hypothetical protein VF423_11450 [Actinomycetes bacterium]